MANLRPNLDTAVLALLDVSAVTTVATGGVYNTFTQPGVKPPFVIFQAISIPYTRTLGVRFGRATYLIKGISESRWPKEAAEIDTQIDLVMEDATPSISGYNFVTGMCKREEDFYLLEESGGKIWTHQGGLYLIEAGEA